VLTGFGGGFLLVISFVLRLLRGTPPPETLDKKNTTEPAA
jgi:hypothetical protein